MFAKMLFKSGLGLGAGLSYFLDPDLGHARREVLLHKLQSLGDGLNQVASEFFPRKAGTLARRVIKTGERALGVHQPARAPAFVALGVGGAAVGAVVTFFLDPERG